MGQRGLSGILVPLMDGDRGGPAPGLAAAGCPGRVCALTSGVSGERTSPFWNRSSPRYRFPRWITVRISPWSPSWSQPGTKPLRSSLSSNLSSTCVTPTSSSSWSRVGTTARLPWPGLCRSPGAGSCRSVLAKASSAPCAVALTIASGEIIYLTDADCRFDDASFERLIWPIAACHEQVVTGASRPLPGRPETTRSSSTSPPPRSTPLTILLAMPPASWAAIAPYQ